MIKNREIRNCDGCEAIEPCTFDGVGKWFCTDCRQNVVIDADEGFVEFDDCDDQPEEFDDFGDDEYDYDDERGDGQPTMYEEYQDLYGGDDFYDHSNDGFF